LRVALSIEALDVLERAARPACGSACPFPGHHGRPLGGKAMMLMLKRLGVDATVHGTCRADASVDTEAPANELPPLCR
jgi:hypothetical protein